MIGTMTNWPGHAVLQVGVPELESWIVARTRHYDPGFVSSDPRFRHAHITVLAPLTDWDSAAIARIAAGTPGFSFELNRVDVFPDGCLYLPPTPDQQFRELTRQAWAAHPHVKPNGAPSPAPHLTVDRLAPEVTMASTRALLGRNIPVTCHAKALELVWYEADNCHLIERYELGLTVMR